MHWVWIMMTYKVALFNNVYPDLDKGYGGIFIDILKKQLEERNVEVDLCCKRGKGIMAYGEYYRDSVDYLKNNKPDIIQIEQFPHSAVVPCMFNNKCSSSNSCKLLTRFHGFTDSSFGNFSSHRGRHIKHSFVAFQGYQRCINLNFVAL